MGGLLCCPWGHMEGLMEFQIQIQVQVQIQIQIQVHVYFGFLYQLP